MNRGIDVRKLLGVWALGAVAVCSYADEDTPYKLRIESGQFWINRNDARIPGDSGTLFGLNDLTGRGAKTTNTRFDLTYKQNKDTEWRLLYAPFSSSGTGNLDAPVTFRGTVFSAGPTFAYYQFNSYRLTYRRTWKDTESSKWMFGYTLKVRDAEIRLEQGGKVEAEKDPRGIVPLLHLSGFERVSDKLFFDFDIDGLFAPQGRAIDLGARLNYQINARGDSFFVGGRVLEGGADNPKVYSFAAVYYFSVGYTVKF
jgi:hypothetical protein